MPRDTHSKRFVVFMAFFAAAVLGFIALLGFKLDTPAHGATAKQATSQPWIYDGWFFAQQSSSSPGSTVRFDAQLNLTDYYKPSTSGKGLRRVKTVISLPPGTTFGKRSKVLILGCRGVPKSWCTVTKADKKLVVQKTTSGVILTWNMYHVRMRPVSVLRFWPKLPDNASGQFCVSAKASPYGAGKDPLGHPAHPDTEHACVQVTGSQTTTAS